MIISFLVLFFISSFFFINSGNFYLLIEKILIISVWILNFVHWRNLFWIIDGYKISLVKKIAYENRISYRESKNRIQIMIRFFLLHQQWKFLFVGRKNFNYLNINWMRCLRNLFWVIGGYNIFYVIGEKNYVQNKTPSHRGSINRNEQWYVINFFFFINSENFYLSFEKNSIISLISWHF